MSSMVPFNHPGYTSDDWWSWPMRSRIMDQHFAMGLLDDRFYRMPASIVPHFVHPGFYDGLNQERTGYSDVINSSDKFLIKLDVAHFKPEEIKLKTVDNHLVVEGNHEEKMDQHGFVKRSFVRRYVIPPGVDVSAIRSSFNRDGVLTIQAPKKAVEETEGRPIAIQTDQQKGESSQQRKT